MKTQGGRSCRYSHLPRNILGAISQVGHLAIGQHFANIQVVVNEDRMLPKPVSQNLCSNTFHERLFPSA